MVTKEAFVTGFNQYAEWLFMSVWGWVIILAIILTVVAWSVVYIIKHKKHD